MVHILYHISIYSIVYILWPFQKNTAPVTVLYHSFQSYTIYFSVFILQSFTLLFIQVVKWVTEQRLSLHPYVRAPGAMTNDARDKDLLMQIKLSLLKVTDRRGQKLRVIIWIAVVESALTNGQVTSAGAFSGMKRHWLNVCVRTRKTQRWRRCRYKSKGKLRSCITAIVSNEINWLIHRHTFVFPSW